MSRRCLCLLLLSCAAARSGSAEPDVPKVADPSFARRLWAVSDLVLDHHVDPPARQQILLAGAKELLVKSKLPVAHDLSARVSRITTFEQWDALVNNLVAKPADAETTAAAIESALEVVPGKAHLYSPEDVKSVAINENNNYVGVGIQIRRNDKEKLAEIVIPFAGGPYRRAGGKAGDLLAEVDGKSMAGLGLAQVVQALRGPEGTAVTILAHQPGSTEKRLLKMIREVIPFQSAFGYRRVSEDAFEYRPDPKLPVAYIRLEQLSSSTYHELRGIERQMRAAGNRALVLDLRETTPGAILHAARVADAFLDGGLMWKVRDAQDRITEYKADRDCLFRDWPMVVLVNESTVDSAAVIAEALQDRGRAVLVGSPSLAGTTVRSLVLLPDGTGGVNLTTGTVERLKPAKVPGQIGAAVAIGVIEFVKPANIPGLIPDVPAAIDQERFKAIATWHHNQVAPEPSGEQPPADPQLAKALDLIREMLKDKKEKIAG